MFWLTNLGRSTSQYDSLVGNGLHLPSIMVAFLLMRQTVGRACVSSQLSYCSMESQLRGLVRGAVWQPGIVESFPGVYSASVMWEDVCSMFHVPRFGKAPWDSVGRGFCTGVSRLLTAWDFTCLRFTSLRGVSRLAGLFAS